MTHSQEHLVAERGSEENFEHGTSEEEKNEFEVLIHEEPKQAYDGNGRRTVVENASYSMESLSDFTDAYESVLRACKELEAYYENIEDSRKLGAVSKELDAIKEDFSEVEGIVKGYLADHQLKTKRSD